MRRTLAIRGAILVVTLGVLAGVAQQSGMVGFNLTSGDGPPEDKVARGKLAAADLNTDGEEGWGEILNTPPVTRSDKAKPRLSSAVFTGEFICHKAEPDPPETIAFVPVQTEERNVKSAFRRKDRADNPNKAKGQSKFLSQRVAEFSNDGEGGMSGSEKAAAVLEQIRGILENPACVSLQWKTQDPPSPTNPTGSDRVWEVVKQTDPDLGDTPGPGAKKNAVHFRVISTIAPPPSTDLPEAEASAVQIENDIIIIRRGRVLTVMIETSPGGHPNAADEAKGRAGKADNKMKGSLES